ncbi:MAG: class I SAM-dependent methyltransferase [Candidatus Helarchaeota archaeon]
MDQNTKQFYDEFWPKNVPYYEETKKYMQETIRETKVNKSLDAGCGHGVCSVVLSEFSEDVTAVDISTNCITTAKSIADKFNRHNISFINEDLQVLSLPDNQYDLVWCWGVAMMAPEPMKVIHNLFRVTKPGGVIYLGLYLETWLSPVHQGVRYFCRKFMNTPARKQFVLNFSQD